jgi:hypothetical protein
MKKILMLTTMLLSINLQAATNYQEQIFKDFIIEPTSFVNSKFYKSTNKNSNYNRFFSLFVIDKELQKSLSDKNSLSDVLNVCYEVYLNRENDKYINNIEEGKFCLYNYAIAGSAEAYSYISTYHFDKYKEIIVSKNKIDVNNLIKMSIYAGLSDSSHIKKTTEGVLPMKNISFQEIINQPIVKIKNKNILTTYYNKGLLSSLDLPVNSTMYKTFDLEHYTKISNEYIEALPEDNRDDIKMFKDLKRNGFRALQQKLVNLHKVKDQDKGNPDILEAVKLLDGKESKGFKKICKDSLYGDTQYELIDNTPEFCLLQISLNDLDRESSYDLGLYFYARGNNIQKDMELRNKFYKKGLTWLALSYELGNVNSKKVFKRILLSFKSNKNEFNEIVQIFSFERKMARLLIEKKVRN